MKHWSLNFYTKASIVVIGLIAISFLTFWFVNASPDSTKQNAIQSVSLNDVTVSLMSVEASDSQVKSQACIELPDNQDWLPYAYLEVKGEQIPVEEVALMNAKNSETYESSYRCYDFSFPTTISGDSTKVKFVVEKLQTTLPEFLTEGMCIEAEKEIQITYPDFSFSCDIGKQGIGFSISSKPENMNDDEAYSLIFEALTDKVEGPWELAYTLK
jgi:hypothetical protein